MVRTPHGAIVRRLAGFFAGVAVVGGGGAAAQSSVSSVVGVQKITVNPVGANLFAAPMHGKPAYTGTVGDVDAGTVSVTGSPGWTAGQFGIVDGFKQFLVILVKDASEAPGNAGDWWLITANDSDRLTVDTSFLSPAASLASGDAIEVRPLTTVADLFGLGPATVMRPNLSGVLNLATDDVIRRLEGTFFSQDIFYYGGSFAPHGYYTSDGAGPLDGSTITFKPDEPIMFFRRGTAATLASVGRVQATPLTHFLTEGATAVSTGFPVGAPIGSSRLLESGWTSNVSGVSNLGENDVLRLVQGTFFAGELFHYAGSAAPNGWYSNSGSADSFLLDGVRGFVAFVRNPSGLIWRQPAPF